MTDKQHSTAGEAIAEYEQSVLAHADAHRLYDTLAAGKPLEKDAAVRRIMGADESGKTSYSAAERTVEDDKVYHAYLEAMREADYRRLLFFGEVRANDHRCALAVVLVAGGVGIA